MAKQGKKENRTNPATLTQRFDQFKFEYKHGPVEAFKAWDRKLERWVIFKIYRQDVIRRASRFNKLVNEVRQLSQVTSPHVARIFDFGKQENLAYVALEATEGTPLLEAINTYAFAPQEIAKLGKEMADGLSATVEVGVLHRNLNPDNIVVTKEGFAKIVDYGLGLFVGTANVTNVTRSGYLIGKEGYVAPELVAGGRSTELSEVFSLGVILYEALTGQLPYKAEEIVTFAGIGELDRLTTTAPSRLVTGLDTQLSKIVLAAIAPNAEERIGSAVVFCERLTSWLESAPPCRPLAQIELKKEEAPKEKPEKSTAKGKDRNKGLETTAAYALPQKPAKPLMTASQNEIVVTAISIVLILCGGLIAMLAPSGNSRQVTELPTTAANESSAHSKLPKAILVAAESQIGPSPSAMRALHSAAWSSRADLVDQLIKGGANVNALDADKQSAVFIAAHRGSLKIVSSLLVAGANRELADKQGRLPIHMAALRGHQSIVKTLLLGWQNVDRATTMGATALHYGAEGGSASVVAELLSRRADVNAKDQNGSTPLHRAAACGNLEVVNLLLNSGAVPDARNKDGLTPSVIALMNGYEQVSKYIDNKAN